MKVFKYKFTRLTSALIYVGIVLCIAGIGLNIFTIATTDLSSEPNITFTVIQYALMFLIPIILLVILVSLLLSSYYAIDGTTLKTSFGIIKSKYDIGEIETVLLDRSTNKLTVYFKDNNFIVIVVKEEWYNDFIDAICKANRNIEFSIKSKENDDNDDKKKS